MQKESKCVLCESFYKCSS